MISQQIKVVTVSGFINHISQQFFSLERVAG